MECGSVCAFREETVCCRVCPTGSFMPCYLLSKQLNESVFVLPYYNILEHFMQSSELLYFSTLAVWKFRLVEVNCLFLLPRRVFLSIKPVSDAKPDILGKWATLSVVEVVIVLVMACVKIPLISSIKYCLVKKKKHLKMQLFTHWPFSTSGAFIVS